MPYISIILAAVYDRITKGFCADYEDRAVGRALVMYEINHVRDQRSAPTLQQGQASRQS